MHLTVRGRKSGLARRVVLEVIGDDPFSGALVIASAWGRRAHWFRNLQACPRAQARVGRREFAAEVVPLDEPAAAEALQAYARAHRWAYRWFIGRLLSGHRPVGTPSSSPGWCARSRSFSCGLRPDEAAAETRSSPDLHLSTLFVLDGAGTDHLDARARRRSWAAVLARQERNSHGLGSSGERPGGPCR